MLGSDRFYVVPAYRTPEQSNFFRLSFFLYDLRIPPNPPSFMTHEHTHCSLFYSATHVAALVLIIITYYN